MIHTLTKKDNVKLKLNEANFPQNEIMAITHSNLRKNIVEIVEMVYLLRKLHKNFMYCLQNVKENDI